MKFYGTWERQHAHDLTVAQRVDLATTRRILRPREWAMLYVGVVLVICLAAILLLCPRGCL